MRNSRAKLLAIVLIAGGLIALTGAGRSSRPRSPAAPAQSLASSRERNCSGASRTAAHNQAPPDNWMCRYSKRRPRSASGTTTASRPGATLLLPELSRLSRRNLRKCVTFWSRAMNFVIPTHINHRSRCWRTRRGSFTESATGSQLMSRLSSSAMVRTLTRTRGYRSSGAGLRRSRAEHRLVVEPRLPTSSAPQLDALRTTTGIRSVFVW
jgi:hypothetical protein